MAQLKELLVTGAARFINGVFTNGTSSMNDINPAATGTYSLGTSSLIWNNLYVNNLYSGAATFSGNIIPNGTRDIGASNNKWNTIYATTFNGTATQANSLALNPSTRASTLNYDLKSMKGLMQYSLATSAANDSKTKPTATETTNGKDCHVLTFAWDSSTGWGAQLAVSDGKNNHLFVRGSTNSSGDSDWDTTWRTVLDSGNYNSYALPLTGGTLTGQLHINYNEDVGLNQAGSLIIGPKDGNNIAIDANEIMARNNSAAATLLLNHEGGTVAVGGYSNTNYALSTASFICNSWVRTVGNTGWYNETHGGGWFMQDPTWIRNHSNKQVFISRATAATTTNLSSQLVLSSLGTGAETGDSAEMGTTAGGSVAIELWRGSNGSWQIMNNGAILFFQSNWNSTKKTAYQVKSLILNYDSGAASLPYLAVGQEDRTTDYRLYVKGNNSVTNNSKVKIENTKLEITNYANTLTIGSRNSNWIHFESATSTAGASASPFWFSTTMHVNGDFLPYQTTNTRNLGSTEKRWAKLYIGTDDTYGGEHTAPIYWSGGTPRAVKNIDLSVTNETTYKVVKVGNSYGTIGLLAAVNRGLYDYAKDRWLIYNTNTENPSENPHTCIPLWASIGSSTKGVYFNTYGEPVEMSYSLNATIDEGTANRLTYYSGANAISETSHYASATKIAVNITSEQSYTFYVNGTSYLKGNTKVSGTITASSSITASNGSVWAQTTSATERNIGVARNATYNAGAIYFYSNGSTTGSRGIYGTNNAGTGGSILTVDQDNAVTLHGSADKLDGKHLSEIAAAKSTSISWDTETTIATIGGNDIKITIPANPQLTIGTGATNAAAGNHTHSTYLLKTGGTVSGTLKLSRTTDAAGTADNQPALMIGSETGSHLEFDGNEIMAKASGTTTGPLYLNQNGGEVYVNGKAVWKDGDAVTGAVWNDYAEYRRSAEREPGRVVMEDDNGVCQTTTTRLQPFAGVVSDTWGFSQGKTAEADTNLAVAGRVLVYTHDDRINYHPGDCVCADEYGTVSVMSREEIVFYPDRIVGIVSEIPTYDMWGDESNLERPPVKVNGRIWIRVR